MSIDWSKAPEWAKGHGLVVQGAIKQVWFGDRAYMIVGDSRSYVYGGGSGETRHNHMPDAIQYKTARPAAWTGEGLPPVGAVCEHLNFGGVISDAAAWSPVTILAHVTNDPRISPVAVYMPCMRSVPCVGQGIAETFRPIRTPEQIAADERKIAVQAMVDVLNSGIKINSFQSTCEALYDAGYRRVEQ